MNKGSMMHSSSLKWTTFSVLKASRKKVKRRVTHQERFAGGRYSQKSEITLGISTERTWWGELVQSFLGRSRIEKSRARQASNPRSWEGNREELAVIGMEKAGGGAPERAGGGGGLRLARKGCWCLRMGCWDLRATGASPGGALPISLVQERPKKASNQNPYCPCGKDHP